MVQPRQLGLMQLEERFAQIISEEKQDSHSLSLSHCLLLSHLQGVNKETHSPSAHGQPYCYAEEIKTVKHRQQV